MKIKLMAWFFKKLGVEQSACVGFGSDARWQVVWHYAGFVLGSKLPRTKGAFFRWLGRIYK